MVALHERYHHRAPGHRQDPADGRRPARLRAGRRLHRRREDADRARSATPIVQETRSAFQNAMQHKFIADGRAAVGPRACSRSSPTTTSAPTSRSSSSSSPTAFRRDASQGGVEERDDAPLVLRRRLADGVGVVGVGQVPVLDRSARRLVVEDVEVALDRGAGRDQQRRRLDARRSGPRAAGPGASPDSTRIVVNISQPGGVPSSTPLQALPVLERAGGGAVGDQRRRRRRARRRPRSARRRRSRGRARRSARGRRRPARLRNASAPAMSLAQSQP